jgi:hypothetical protein
MSEEIPKINILCFPIHVSHVSFITPLVSKNYTPCFCHVRTSPVSLQKRTFRMNLSLENDQGFRLSLRHFDQDFRHEGLHSFWPLHSVLRPTVSFSSFSPPIPPSRPFPHTFPFVFWLRVTWCVYIFDLHEHFCFALYNTGHTTDI